VPLVVGEAQAAMDAAARLRAAGLLVRAVRPPTVPAGTARLRLCFHATNTDAELERLVEALEPLARARAAVPARACAAHELAVCGTGTGVGKTVVSALLLRAAARRGAAAYWKPLQTGAESDTSAVERLAGIRTRFEPGQQFALPAAPHAAAAAEGARVDLGGFAERLAANLRALGSGVLVTELAGGLYVPLDEETTQLDLLARRRPALVLVADSGLGTLNHTLLSLEALRARALEPRALFLVGAPHASNRATLARMGRVTRTFELPRLDPLDARALDAWIDAHDLDGVWPEEP
jgi:dethiobiotin synthase